MNGILKHWWQGAYVPPPPNDPYSGFIFISPGTYKLHWSSRAAHMALDFWLKYWQWCLGFGLAVVGLIWKH